MTVNLNLHYYLNINYQVLKFNLSSPKFRTEKIKSPYIYKSSYIQLILCLLNVMEVNIVSIVCNSGRGNS